MPKKYHLLYKLSSFLPKPSFGVTILQDSNYSVSHLPKAAVGLTGNQSGMNSNYWLQFNQKRSYSESTINNNIRQSTSRLVEDNQQEITGEEKTGQNEQKQRKSFDRVGWSGVGLATLSLGLHGKAAYDKYQQDLKDRVKEEKQNIDDYVKQISSDYATKDGLKSNPKFMSKINNLYKRFNEDTKLREYFIKQEDPQVIAKLVYCFNVLATDKGYNKEYKEMREVITLSKLIMDSYTEGVSSKMTKEEVLKSYNTIKEFLAVYTRLIYLEARSYIYEGDLQNPIVEELLKEAKGYCEVLSEDHSFHIFEEHLIEREGLCRIRDVQIDQLIQDDKEGIPDRARRQKLTDLLRENINKYQSLKVVENGESVEYINNYNPAIETEQQKILKPHNDAQNFIKCSYNLSKYYFYIIEHNNILNLPENSGYEVQNCFEQILQNLIGKTKITTQDDETESETSLLSIMIEQKNSVNRELSKRGLAFQYNKVANILEELYNNKNIKNTEILNSLSLLPQYLVEKLGWTSIVAGTDSVGDQIVSLRKKLYEQARELSNSNDHTWEEANEKLVELLLYESAQIVDNGTDKLVESDIDFNKKKDQQDIEKKCYQENNYQIISTNDLQEKDVEIVGNSYDQE